MDFQVDLIQMSHTCVACPCALAELGVCLLLVHDVLEALVQRRRLLHLPPQHVLLLRVQRLHLGHLNRL